MKCEECGKSKKEDEVLKTTRIWGCGGRNCFDFNWYEYKEVHWLCGECEYNQYHYCYYCGALIPNDYYGHGYLPDDYEGETICPGCALKKGFQVDVNIVPLKRVRKVA